MACALLFIDDHPLFREGMARALSEVLPDTTVHSVASLADAQSVLDRCDIDLVLADYRLAEGDGVDAVRAIRRQFPTVACGLISGELSPVLSRLARQAGAVAMLSKTRTVEALAQAVSALMDGQSVFDDAHEVAVDDGLTPRRLEILQLASRGDSNKVIARALGVTERTIKDHWTHILARLGASNRTEAVGIALRNGLIKRHD